MKILYLHQYFSTPSMPGGSRSYELARKLVSYGHEVNMITSCRELTSKRGWYQTEESGIKVHWYPVKYSNHMSYTSRIKAFMKFAWVAARKSASIPADVIFATSTPLTIAIPAIYASRRQKIPMVFEVRDLWPKVPIAVGVIKNPVVIRGALWLENIAYRNARRIVALAPGMKTDICSQGFDSNKIDVIPNGADIERFNQVDISAKQIEEQYPFVKKKNVILYIGTIGIVNGVNYIPRLASFVSKAQQGKAIVFIVVGDGKCRNEAIKYAQEMGVLNKNVFFVGQVPKDEVPMWLKLSKATIITYDGPEIVFRDSVSNKYFDSLAAGRPIFANFLGFSTKIAQANGAGLILPKEDMSLATKMLCSCINDPEWLVSASRAALELGRRYFDRNELAKMLELSLKRSVNGSKDNEEPIGMEFERLEKQVYDEAHS